MKKLLGNLRKTVQEYELITDGDRVAVGLSGGKDSMALLYLLEKFRKFAPFKFDLEAITVDMGFNNFDLDAAEVFCKELNVPYTIVKTDIAKIVFEIREEKNPCALCANMRRGVLSNTMNERNLNLLALGHHQDDALATMFLNMLYAGKLNTLEYKSYLSRADVHVIRPFLNSTEADIKGLIKAYDIPVLKSPCPMDRNTKREEINQLIGNIEKEIPFSRKSMVSAMRNETHCNLFVNKKSSSR